MSPHARFIRRSALALVLCLGQTVAVSPLAVLASDGSIRLAGQTVFVNKVAAGGMSVEQRAETIQRNLDNALVAAKDRSPSSVSIVYVKGVPVITLGGYQVATVDADNARLAGTTPAVLAQRWADALRQALTDRQSIDSYVAQLTGTYQGAAPSYSAPPQTASSATYSPPPQGPAPGAPAGYAGYSQPPQYSSYDQYSRTSQPSYGMPVQRGRVVYAPAGLVLPATLNTSISTQAAQSGDFIQATVSQAVLLGDSSQIPAGSVLIGQVTEVKGGGYLGRAATLAIKFNRMRTPDGVETPISAHIQGGIGKYDDRGGNDGDVFRGETWKTKAGQAAIRGAVGAGTGAALGTAIGAIAGGGRGVGRGAWSGTAIGAGAGVAQSLILRKGKDVNIPSGQQIQVQLDAPVSISVGGPVPYAGAF